MSWCQLRPALVLGICKPISPGWWNKDLTCLISTPCSARIEHPPKSRAPEEALVAISRQTGSRLPRTRAILISFFAHSTIMPNRTNSHKITIKKVPPWWKWISAMRQQTSRRLDIFTSNQYSLELSWSAHSTLLPAQTYFKITSLLILFSSLGFQSLLYHQFDAINWRFKFSRQM